MREPLEGDVTAVLEGGPAAGQTHVLAGRTQALTIPSLIGGQYRALRYVDSGRRNEWGAQIWVQVDDPLPGKSEPPHR